MQTHDEFSAQAIDQLQELIKTAKKAGADEADALLGKAHSVSHQLRMGHSEGVERSEDSLLGLRVIVGKHQALVSSNDLSKQSFDGLVERAVAMAKQVPEDPYCGLAHQDQLASNMIAANLDAEDPVEPSADLLIERAKQAEETALSHDGITNSEGASASWSLSRIALAGSNGFLGTRSASNHSLFANVIAGSGLEMESDYDYSSAVYGEDLTPANIIGDHAASRALSRLSPKRPPTKKVPIIFDKRVSASLLSSLAGAINGQSIARKTSFLLDALGTQIFDSAITISDDPHRKRGLASKFFDGEGLATAPRNFVENGILTSWILDCRSAKQLGLQSTANAARGASSLPRPSVGNFTLHAGTQTPESLYQHEECAFLVTHLMGMGVNGVTGDYSQGASGFWIEKGEIAYPVNEATIAGNLKTMFLALTPANDLEFKGATNAPSVRIDGMMLAAG
ncbi:MAG: TldD/PmbA family protein [Alphaproteobacteria bacterium]